MIEHRTRLGRIIAVAGVTAVLGVSALTPIVAHAQNYRDDYSGYRHYGGYEQQGYGGYGPGYGPRYRRFAGFGAPFYAPGYFVAPPVVYLPPRVIYTAPLVRRAVHHAAIHHVVPVRHCVCAVSRPLAPVSLPSVTVPLRTGPIVQPPISAPPAAQSPPVFLEPRAPFGD